MLTIKESRTAFYVGRQREWVSSESVFIKLGVVFLPDSHSVSKIYATNKSLMNDDKHWESAESQMVIASNLDPFHAALNARPNI